MVPGDQLLDALLRARGAGSSGSATSGVELTKQLLWASLDAGSLHSHMNHEGNAQLYVRMTTSNFDEKIAAGRKGARPCTPMSEGVSCGSTARSSIVTGAGRNLGREYALMFAARGARVLVNDLGVGISDTDGVAEAPSDPPADAVVAEIVAAGGEAVANRDTIATPEGGRAIVDAALDAFGTVDVVVNNAGQVRMAPFTELTEAQLDAVIDTQLRGPFNVSRPGVGGHGRTGRRSVRQRVVGCRVRRGPRRRGLRHGQDGGDRPHARDGVGGSRRRHRRQRDHAVRQDPAGHRLRSVPGQRGARGVVVTRGWSRRSSGGWPTKRARCRASASAWAAGTTPGRPRGHRGAGRPRRDHRTLAADASAILDSPATPITTTVSDNMRRMFEGFRPPG